MNSSLEAQALDNVLNPPVSDIAKTKNKEKYKGNSPNTKYLENLCNLADELNSHPLVNLELKEDETWNYLDKHNSSKSIKIEPSETTNFDNTYKIIDHVSSNMYENESKEIDLSDYKKKIYLFDIHNSNSGNINHSKCTKIRVFQNYITRTIIKRRLPCNRW